MRAVISTPLHLLHLDLETRRLDVVEAHRPCYYGLSWFPGSRDLVASHCDLEAFADLESLEGYARSEVGYLSRGEGRSPRFLSAPHQLLCASDGRVVVANTGRNRVQAVAFERPGLYHEAALSDTPWDRFGACDGEHLNSVFERDGRLYVLSHGHGAKDSVIAVFSYPDLRPLSQLPVKGRSSLHNVWVTDAGDWITCDTHAGALIEAKSGERLWENASGGLARGLAVSADHVLVGDSEPAPRPERGRSAGGVWLIERKSWRTLDYIPLGPFGGVHELRLLDLPDEAHHRCPLLEPDRLLERAHPRAVARDRVAASRAAQGLRAAVERHWAGWRPVLGLAQAAAEGFQLAEQLCLWRPEGPGAAADEVAFDYRLGSAEGGHAAAVFDYRGDGDDRSMTALLLQVTGGSAQLSHWTHDGTQWTLDPQHAASRLPRQGSLRAVRAGGRLQVFVDGKRVLSLPATGTGEGGTLGIRWIACEVRPAPPTRGLAEGKAARQR